MLLNCTGTCSKFPVYFALNRRNKLYLQLLGLLLCNYNVFIGVQPGSKALSVVFFVVHILCIDIGCCNLPYRVVGPCRLCRTDNSVWEIAVVVVTG